jgi:hypothetical protein
MPNLYKWILVDNNIDHTIMSLRASFVIHYFLNPLLAVLVHLHLSQDLQNYLDVVILSNYLWDYLMSIFQNLVVSCGNLSLPKLIMSIPQQPKVNFFELTSIN